MLLQFVFRRANCSNDEQGNYRQGKEDLQYLVFKKCPYYLGLNIEGSFLSSDEVLPDGSSLAKDAQMLPKCSL